MSGDVTISQLRGPILRSVSRSFYLSVRLLPGSLREPIALAYLLARSTDTIADTTSIERELRLRELASLRAQIQGNRQLPHSLGDFVSQQTDPAERTLLESIPACLSWLESTPQEDRADIRHVLQRINEGQTLDVERFSDRNKIASLETEADLLRYTYLVAGSVGEFWTSVCFRHLPTFSKRPRQEMMMLGLEYGRALQLINILRDAGSDLRTGRCYLPEKSLQAVGVAPAELRLEPTRALSVFNTWRERAAQKLVSGIEYACAIRPFRLRLATALPALIGARTLALLRDAGAEVFDQKVKVSRGEVRGIILRASATLASPTFLRGAFQKLSS